MLLTEIPRVYGLCSRLSSQLISQELLLDRYTLLTSHCLHAKISLRLSYYLISFAQLLPRDLTIQGFKDFNSVRALGCWANVNLIFYKDCLV